ncbi:MAG TPA: restriction endonuclease subunit M [Syntrophaceae bacterium]|nr:restriction endonuclease subunit M [Syntrophaceae bacterium]
MTKEEGKEKVKGLIELFKGSYAEKTASEKRAYNEATVREKFLNPFFDALGWAMASNDVEVEYSQVREDDGSKGKADYRFNLGAGKEFYVEAKKPSENLAAQCKHAIQARRYAYSANHTVTILTDFEEFQVYLGRGKAPKDEDQINTAMVSSLSCQYTDYLDRWDDIWRYFSRESVLAGSLENVPGVKKGAKGDVTVDALFLADIEKWRQALAENIYINNADLTPRLLNELVQKTIDRIIFLRICEDRDIESYGRILKLKSKPNIYKGLLALFRQADERYNSGLFHFKKESDREDFDDISCKIIIEDEPLIKIIDRLYWPGGPYAFAVMPADILGQVYERFLGKVIEIGERGLTVEEKPEVKKAGGVFYTPEYIVDYIVKNTVGRLLEGKKPDTAAKIKILDPACGSGAFLINAYQCLLDWHLDWHKANNPEKYTGKNKPLIKDDHDNYRLSLAERKKILLNNIHGVDIDSQAVEVARLSLLLKCLEGQNRHSLQTELFHERLLPDLDGNVKCGNSLIGRDFYDDQQGSLFDMEQKLKINAFDWNTEFKAIMADSGFDAVIGNPPYVGGSVFEEQYRSYIESKYCSYEYQLNMFSIFIEKGINLLKQDGRISYITPAVFLAQHYFKNIRDLILKNNIDYILLLNYKVFESADTGDTCVFQISKNFTKDHKVRHATIRKMEDFADIDFKIKSQSEFVANIRSEFNVTLDKNFVEKISISTVKLKEIAEIIMGIKPYQKGKGVPKQTESTVTERIFDSKTKSSEIFKQYLIGKDIDRYTTKPIEERFIKYGKWLAEPRVTAPFDRTKIILRQTSDKIRATLDEDRYCNLNNIYNIELKNGLDHKFLLGILNSKLFIFVYQSIVPEKGRVFAEVKKVNLGQLPIRTIALENPAEKQKHDDMVALVDAMLKYHKALQQTGLDSQSKKIIQDDIASTECKIDSLVYELYGLTPEEQRLVEGKL